MVGHEILDKTEHLYRNVYLNESEFGETLTDNADGNTEGMLRQPVESR